MKIDDAGAANGSLWDAASVAEAIGDLNRAARAMRARRFAGGALRLDQAKLLFRLNPGTGSPVSVFPYQTRESNHLVEEFMLLANAAAARLVSAAFPERAMLRCHPPPNERKLADLEQFAREQGLEVDASSAAALHRSLARLRESHRDGYEIVQLLATLPMQLARYFSTGAQDRDTLGALRARRAEVHALHLAHSEGTPTCWCTTSPRRWTRGSRPRGSGGILASGAARRRAAGARRRRRRRTRSVCPIPKP